MAEYANSSIIGGGGFSTNDSPTNPANPPPTKGSEKISKLIEKIKDKLDVIKKLNDDPDNQVTETNDGPLLTFGKKTVKDLKEKGKKKLDAIVAIIMNMPGSENNASYPKPKLRRG